MRTVAARARAGWTVFTVKAAAVAGSLLRSVPGAAGALLVSYGAWQAWEPAGPIVAGGFLLLLDRRVP